VFALVQIIGSCASAALAITITTITNIVVMSRVTEANEMMRVIVSHLLSYVMGAAYSCERGWRITQLQYFLHFS
jgi:hypothetical protein